MTTPAPSSPQRIAVLGAGQMGSGMATILADAGHAVSLWDAFPAVSARVASAWKAPSGSSGTLTFAGELEEAVTGADIIFEAIAENLAAKHEVFGRISKVNPTGIVATNTSSLPSSSLADSISNPSRFAIAHFFNPPRIVPLVEVVPCSTTDPAVLDTLCTVLKAAGKVPVKLKREVPGFVANRLQSAMLREAFSLVADGVATFEDIDTVVRGALAARWAAAGPMMVTDLGGLDIWQAVTTHLFPLLSNATASPEAITSRVAKGDLGAKTGTGLYVHDPEQDERTKARMAEHFALDFGSHN